jgi:DNA polymerase-3 subunit gamma/tau
MSQELGFGLDAADAENKVGTSRYQVIARKYRPQSFQDLVGQEHISQTLLNALRGDRLPQALLFTGVRGTGKTSTARILAKSLRCANAQDFVPCGTCRDCQDIATSRAIDVIEIDGASNNGVDAIRELRDTVGYMPSSGRFKIYIIDEVHMLSTAAFNALLKTLEEPPAHVVFVLATTEAQKIPNTILSRCQRFDFRRIPSRVIATHLQKIIEAESVRAETEAIWAIARQGDGSMRDAQSLLDQVITFSNLEITLSKVIEVLGLTDRQLVIDGLTALVQRDLARALQVAESVGKSGVDPKLYAQDLLEEVRNLLMVRLCSEDPTRVVDLPDSEIQALQTLAQEATNEDLHMLFDMSLKTVNDILRSPDPRLVLEMGLLRMAGSPRLAQLSELLAGAPIRPISATSSPTTSPAPSPKASSTSAPRAIPQATPTSPQSPTPGSEPVASSTSATNSEARKYSVDDFTKPAKPGGQKVNIAPPLNEPKTEAPKGASAPSAAAVDDEPTSDDPWHQFVHRVKKSNGLLGALLENTHVVEQSAEHLIVGVPKKVSIIFDKISDPENVKRVENFIETLWSQRLKVSVRMAEASGPAQTPKDKQSASKAERAKTIEQAIEQNPIVRNAKNVFKTQVKGIRDVE